MSEVKEVQVEDVRKVLQKFSDDTHQASRDIDKNRLGKILTIVDSSIADETQRKAMKDLIHDSWYGETHSTRTYPQMFQATEALGFTLYDEGTGIAVSMEESRYNPYKELVKKDK